MTSTYWPVAPAPDGARADAGPTVRTVVVTGACSPIGLATAAVLARLGDLVLMGGSDVDACERVAAGLRASGGAAFAAPLDLAEAASIERFVGSARYLVGDIDALITVGEGAGSDPVGIQHLATHLIPGMLAAGRGDVVLVGPPPRRCDSRGLHGWLAALQAEFVGTGLRARSVWSATGAGAADELGCFVAALLDLD